MLTFIPCMSSLFVLYSIWCRHLINNKILQVMSQVPAGLMWYFFNWSSRIIYDHISKPAKGSYCLKMYIMCIKFKWHCLETILGCTTWYSRLHCCNSTEHVFVFCVYFQHVRWQCVFGLFVTSLYLNIQ